MHVALIANTAWLDEFLPLFKHMVVGLIDEQVRVAQVVPEGRMSGDESVFGDLVTWEETRWAWGNRRRLSTLDGSLERVGVNLIHALDGRMWRAARKLGERMNVPVVYSAFSRLDLELLPRMVSSTSPERATFTAATDPLMETMREQVPSSYVLAPLRPGVHVSDEQIGRAETQDETLCIVVAGTGCHDDQYQAFLEGAAAMIERHPSTQLFFDGQGHDQRDVWAAAQKLGLLANASFIPRRLGHRELLLKADLLVHPQCQGRARGMTLQAMARGIPVVTCRDPVLDYMIDGTTARVLKTATAADWKAVLEDCAGDPQGMQSLGRSARDWVAHNRVASTTVAQALRVYRSITGSTMPFQAQRG